MSKPVAIVAGYLVRYPLGGHVLSQLHFLVGLQRLGYEVVFAEQYGWPYSCYDPRTNTTTNDPTYGIAELRRAFEKIGVNRWCYVDADGNYHGMSREELGRVCRDADFLLSVAAVTWLEQFRDCKKRIFWDADPGFTQFGMSATPAPSCDGYASPYDFQFHFTIGERIGKVDCPIPTHGLNWRRNPLADGAGVGDAAVYTGGEVLHDNHELERAQTDHLQWPGVRAEGRRVHTDLRFAQAGRANV